MSQPHPPRDWAYFLREIGRGRESLALSGWGLFFGARASLHAQRGRRLRRTKKKPRTGRPGLAKVRVLTDRILICSQRGVKKHSRSPRSTRNARRFRFLRSSDLQSRLWCLVRSTSVRDKQWVRFEQYCVRKASQAGRSSRVCEAWHRRRQSRKGFTARGPSRPPPP